MAIYSLDGVDLDDEKMRWVLASETTLSTRGEPWRISVDIPNRFGALPIPARVLKPATVVLKFSVFSWEDGRNGNRCKGGLNQLEFNLRALLGRLTAFGRMQQLGYKPQGSILKVADVRLSSSIEPTIDPEAEIAHLTATFEVTSGLWRDPQPTVVNLNDLNPLAGGNLPIPDPWLMLAPSGSSCSLKDNVSGTTFTFNGSLQGAERLLVDVANYRAWKNPSADWTVANGARPADGEISMGLDGFRLDPDASGRISVTSYNCTGYIRARRSY